MAVVTVVGVDIVDIDIQPLNLSQPTASLPQNQKGIVVV
jgi:hypothetical protein